MIPSLFATHFLLASSEQPKQGPGEIMAEMMRKGEELATPNEQHALLSRMCGSWKTTSVVLGTEPQYGQAEGKMILGNRFLEIEYTGTFLSLPLEGTMLLGYDNYKHKFSAVFLDNLGTSIRTAEGTLDQSGTMISFYGTMDEWMTDEHDKAVLYTFRLVDENSFELEVHDLSIVPGDTKAIAVQFQRTD
jgi:hypothetical protein